MYMLFFYGYKSYNIFWLVFDEVEQEVVEVYMFGCVLWCIFEGQCVLQYVVVWQFYKWEFDYEFFEYWYIFFLIRDFIDGCIKGRREILLKFVIWVGSKMVFCWKDGLVDVNCILFEVFDVVRDWWRVEVEVVERFLIMWEELKGRGEWKGNWYGRLRLREVVQRLEEYEREVGVKEVDREVLVELLKRCK